MRTLLLFSLLSLGVTPRTGAQETPGEVLPIREYELDNGLRLIILPRDGAPTVSFVVHYRVGSVNEPEGATGIAHLLEHLLFKGTTSVGTKDFQQEGPILEEMDLLYDSIVAERENEPPDSLRLRRLRDRIRSLEGEASEFTVSGEFDALLSENGARSLNATTTVESTAYFVELPSNRAELWFLMEADRMRNPVFREFFSERDVVSEERRLRLETNPTALLQEAHLSEAFRVHPYGEPVIGRMEDIQKHTRRDLRDFFARFYGPNNAVVAIVGGLDPDQILDWARVYLGGVPRGANPPPIQVEEPRQTEERRVEIRLAAEPSLRIGWRIPSALHPDAPALGVLASLLTGGRGSRLYQRLVLEDRSATGVFSGTGPGQLYPRLFTLDLTPRSPHTYPELEGAVYEELQRLKEEPPHEGELQRVRNQLEASNFRRLRANLSLAFQLAESASLYGSWEWTFSFTRAMQAVTAEDVQRVVRRYFREEGRVVAILQRSAADTDDEQ